MINEELPGIVISEDKGKKHRRLPYHLYSRQFEVLNYYAMRELIPNDDMVRGEFIPSDEIYVEVMSSWQQTSGLSVPG